jgi:hypothetical protein
MTAVPQDIEKKATMISYQQYLRQAAVSRDVIDTFLDPAQPTWAQFDPEVGYVLGNAMLRDGIDGCSTISTSQPNGTRTAYTYTQRPCRINTYGNSFTQCHQVSDGETWQEVLAAHFGEPIRNFGMGGFGVYQAYRRMRRTEQTADGAGYVILYIWGDDHCRSVMRCRHAAIYPNWSHRGGLAFHSNFWANLELDLQSGQFVEHDNRLPTPESLYQMTDPEFMVEALGDDLMVQLYAVAHVDPESLERDRLDVLADHLSVPGLDTSDADALHASARDLRNAYGFAATRWIVDRAARFCEAHDKALLIAMLCPTATRQLLRGERRYDQEIADHVAHSGLPYFDMNCAHLKDYAAFDLSVEDYMARYYIGHYNPLGNHLFAFSIKDALVEWLDPKPITYRDDESAAFDFQQYLSY